MKAHLVLILRILVVLRPPGLVDAPSPFIAKVSFSGTGRVGRAGMVSFGVISTASTMALRVI